MIPNNNVFVNTACLYILVKIAGTLFALYVFNHFTPLIDSKLYIEGFYGNAAFRTLIIQKITTFLVGVSNPLITHIFFSLFSGIGILILSYTMKNRLILLLLLFPTAMVWTSIVGKEAIYYGSMAILLSIWSVQISEVKKRKSLALHAGSLILLTVCMLLRPHYTIPLIYMLTTTFILYTFHNKKIQSILITTILSTAVLLTAYIWMIIPENLMVRGYGSIDSLSRAARFEYYNIDLLNPHLVWTKEFILREGIFGIIGPFPSELLLRLEFIPFFIEGIIILLFPITIGFMLKNTKNYQIYKKYFYYAVVPAILMSIIIHAPFGILNPGSAIRWRVNFELIFYLAPILIYMKSKNDN